VRGFGELESAVMDCVWRAAGETTVREVLVRLREQRELAYTTVMTTMDTLHRKGWLAREKRGKAFSYWATVSREEYSARLMGEALADAENPDVVLTRFLEQMNDTDSERLRRVVRRWASGDSS